MNFKIIFFSLIIIERIVKILKYVIRWHYRFKPLPTEVSDVYDKERYETYISYHKEYVPIFITNLVLGCLLDIVIIFGGFLPWIEKVAYGNEYMIFFLTLVSMMVFSLMYQLPLDYYDTFSIEEKYGLNKKTKKVFFRDYFLENIFELLIMSILGFFIVFICENIGNWTNNFDINYIESLLFVTLIVLAIIVIIIGLQFISLKVLRMKYTFTELEEGALRTQIIDLMKDSKKKVKYIKVYNESKKSTSKNAFLLKFLWHREFGIADNFLNDNSEKELLAVLSHEVGHLKHKKNILDYMHYVFLGIIVVFLVWLIPNASVVIEFSYNVKTAFGLKDTNYYLMMAIISSFYYFIQIFVSMFENYRSRQEELEADLNAVKNGYGEELIQTFKKVSTDELIDVNPAPIIEFLDFDHPGMYQRIVYIKKEMEKKYE